MRERLATLGYEAIASTPDQCAAQLTAETAKWTRVIREAGIKGE
jgi:tripartite-type tricarboxylate transporter receptor subunit TctC